MFLTTQKEVAEPQNILKLFLVILKLKLGNYAYLEIGEQSLEKGLMTLTVCLWEHEEYWSRYLLFNLFT